MALVFSHIVAVQRIEILTLQPPHSECLQTQATLWASSLDLRLDRGCLVMFCNQDCVAHLSFLEYTWVDRAHNHKTGDNQCGSDKANQEYAPSACREFTANYPILWCRRDISGFKQGRPESLST